MPIFEAKCGNIFYKSHDNAMKTCPDTRTGREQQPYARLRARSGHRP